MLLPGVSWSVLVCGRSGQSQSSVRSLHRQHWPPLKKLFQALPDKFAGLFKTRAYSGGQQRRVQSWICGEEVLGKDSPSSPMAGTEIQPCPAELRAIDCSPLLM